MKVPVGCRDRHVSRKAASAAESGRRVRGADPDALLGCEQRPHLLITSRRRGVEVDRYLAEPRWGWLGRRVYVVRLDHDGLAGREASRRAVGQVPIECVAIFMPYFGIGNEWPIRPVRAPPAWVVVVIVVAANDGGVVRSELDRLAILRA